MAIGDSWLHLTVSGLKSYASSSVTQAYGTVWNLWLSPDLILKVAPTVHTRGLRRDILMPSCAATVACRSPSSSTAREEFEGWSGACCLPLLPLCSLSVKLSRTWFLDLRLGAKLHAYLAFQGVLVLLQALRSSYGYGAVEGAGAGLVHV